MPVTRPWLVAAGLLTLALAWLGPLPQLAPRFFSAHMTMHMAVVAVAAPLLALGLAGGRSDPALRAPAVFSALPASVLELVLVWTWHAPALHHMARTTTSGLIAEQGTFLAAGFLVWMSAVGGDAEGGGRRAGAGVVALLLTSMHMTLLGALIALAPRVLYGHAVDGASMDAQLAQQQLGGVIMLIAGGVSYLCGGVWLAARMLATRRGEALQRPPRLA
jgi:putative membrane protein